MLRAFPVLLLLLSTACGLAEDERDEKNKHIYLTFYDKAFESYCLEHFDPNGDGRISRYEAQRVRRMDCSERGIASLSDVREFSNLRQLDCNRNLLTQLDLTALTHLEGLACSGNALLSLDVNGLRVLARIDCSDNDLSGLGLGSNISLLELDCRDNALTTLDLTACPATLRADVRGNPGLEVVYCRSALGITADGHTRIEER